MTGKSKDHVIDWGRSTSENLRRSKLMTEKAGWWHGWAAINQPKTMPGKIVVIPPKKDGNR